jgi:probable HAF family extracellular repeat protein
MTDLGTLGGAVSVGKSINDSGQVTGFSTLANRAGRPFIYDNGVMSDLNSLIDPLSGWMLLESDAINNNGQITGFGNFNGQTRGFLLSPIATNVVPEPASWAMLIAGFGLVGAVQRRRRRLALA